MHFEEVNCSEVGSEAVIEYMAEDEEAVLMSNNGSSVETTIPETVQPVKRKIPIIRKPGEIVTPIRVQALANFEVGSSNSRTPRPTFTARVKPEWTKVKAPSQTLSLAATEPTLDNSSRAIMRAKPIQRSTLFSRNVSNPSSQHTEQTQMGRIEQKMNEILTRLEQNETSILQIKNSITDFTIELKNSITELKEHIGKQSEGSIQEETPKITRPLPSAKRKRMVVFPVADDNYLLRLEELAGTDEEIQEDLTSLFRLAPTNSAYEFLRYNVAALFKNCSRYTWTGKPSNSCPNYPPCNSACNLTLVAHLIGCAAEIFPYATRDSISKEFRRALENFNDAMKRKRHAEKFQASSVAEGSNGAGDDE